MGTVSNMGAVTLREWSLNVTLSSSDSESGIASLALVVDGKTVVTNAVSGATASTTINFDSTTIPDGPHGISAVATDLAGNTSTTASSVNVDFHNHPLSITAVASANPLEMPNTLGLSATGSNTSSTDTFTYQWTQVSGVIGGATISNGNSANATVTFIHPGSYTFQVAVTDTQVNQSTTATTAQITVNGQPILMTAAAGASDVILPNAATLSSTVANPGSSLGALTYQWTQVSGPGTATFTNASASGTQVSFNAPGLYVLQVGATDNYVLGSATVKVMALNASTPPSATYTRPIMIAHTQVPNTDQANFPVLISGTYN